MKEIADCFFLNICTPKVLAGLIALGKKASYTDIKVQGAAVPVPAMHTLLIVVDA
jgi:hypothetical protein